LDGGSPVDLLVEVRDRFGERLEGCLYLGMEKVAWFDAGFKGRASPPRSSILWIVGFWIKEGLSNRMALGG